LRSCLLRHSHKQDANNLHGRAKLVIARLEFPGFDGQVFLCCWDIQTVPASETKSGSPKVKFDAETGGAEQAFETNYAHEAGAPKDVKTLWVEGKTAAARLARQYLPLEEPMQEGIMRGVMAEGTTDSLREALVRLQYDASAEEEATEERAIKLLRRFLSWAEQPQAAPMLHAMLQVHLYNLVFRPQRTTPPA
jgi:hypothetical protein